MDKNTAVDKPASLWRNHDYLLLWVGQAVSTLGTGISQFAFPLLILILTNSPASAGLAGSLAYLPYIVFSLPAGALVDRWNHKWTMIFSTFGLALCLLSVPVALVSEHLTILQIYVVSFTVGTLSLFYQLAELAALTHVVTKTQLSTAIAQNEAAYSITLLVAPSLGGILFNISQMLPFITDVVTYLVLIGSLLRIRSSFQKKRSEISSHLILEIREGMRWLQSHVIIRSLAFLIGYLYVVMSGSVLIVIVIARQQQIPTSIIGLIFAVGGVGSIVGTTLSPSIQSHVRFGWSLGGMLMLFVILWPLYGLARTPIFLGIVGAGLALVDSITSILVASYRLSQVPDKLQGRVGSVYRLIPYGFLTLGQVLIGICLQHFGVLITLGVLWSGLMGFTFLVLLHPLIRQAN